MLGLTSSTRICLYRGICDMRKSFDGLCGIVRSDLGEDPLSGSLFVFVNRTRNMIKPLYWDREGIIEVGCWADARRKFDEAASSRNRLRVESARGVVPLRTTLLKTRCVQ